MKEKNVVAYKVVRKKNGKLFSAAVLNDMVKTQYKVKEWTKAELGGLFVFKNELYAKSFISCTSSPDVNFFIYKCICKERVHKLYYDDRVFWCVKKEKTNEEILGFLKKRWDQTMFSECNRYPPGSLAFKQVKLVEKIGEKRGIEPFKRIEKEDIKNVDE